MLLATVPYCHLKCPSMVLEPERRGFGLSSELAAPRAAMGAGLDPNRHLVSRDWLCLLHIHHWNQE